MKDFKKDFKAWFNENHPSYISLANHWFRSLPSSMQWGVYVDFFNSVGIYILVGNEFKDNNYYTVWYEELKNIEGSYIKTLQEAREQALEKAIDLYNQK